MRGEKNKKKQRKTETDRDRQTVRKARRVTMKMTSVPNL